MSDKTIYAIYDDDYVLLESAKHLVSKGIHIRDVFSPFPIHGIDPVIGLPRTRLPASVTNTSSSILTPPNPIYSLTLS